jgi:hypothetical protein
MFCIIKCIKIDINEKGADISIIDKIIISTNNK